MNEITITQPELAADTAGKLSAHYGGIISFQLDTTISINEGVTRDQLKQAVQEVSGFDRQTTSLAKFVRLWAAGLIREYSARFNTDRMEAVEQLELTDDFGVGNGSYHKWCRVHERIPPEIRSLPNLSMGHLIAAADVPEPEGVEERIEFRLARDAFLREANDDPDKKGRRWIEARMKDLRGKFSTGTRPVGGNEILERFARASVLLQKWDAIDSLYPKEDIVNTWEALHNALIERNLVSPDYCLIELPPVADL